MAIFEERERGFEEKFAHDEEFQFRVTARRNRLLGLWVAEQLGLAGANAEAYAKDVVVSEFGPAGDDNVFEKVWADMHANSLRISEQQVRYRMQELMDEAHEQLKLE